jgi:hypothetical protein
MLSAEVDLEVDVTSEDVLQAHRERVKEAADLGFSVSQEHVPVDTGELQQSGFPPEFRGDDVVFGYTARQALPMEKGTEPGHTPPIEPLKRWAERIGKDPRLRRVGGDGEDTAGGSGCTAISRSGVRTHERVAG